MKQPGETLPSPTHTQLFPSKATRLPTSNNHSGCIRVFQASKALTTVITVSSQLVSEACAITAALAATIPAVTGTMPDCI